jgi:hypothetical protein
MSGVEKVKVGDYYASNKALPAIASAQSVNPMAERRLGTVRELPSKQSKLCVVSYNVDYTSHKGEWQQR